MSQINPLHIINSNHIKINFYVVGRKIFVEVQFPAGTRKFLLAPRSRLTAATFILLASGVVFAGDKKATA